MTDRPTDLQTTDQLAEQLINQANADIGVHRKTTLLIIVQILLSIYLKSGKLQGRRFRKSKTVREPTEWHVMLN